jgi:hypothetical protein
MIFNFFSQAMKQLRAALPKEAVLVIKIDSSIIYKCKRINSDLLKCIILGWTKHWKRC